MKTKAEIESIINGATGTFQHHRFSIIPQFVCTDGCIELAEAAGCYWLLDAIVSHQRNRKLDRQFQVWTLTVVQKKNRREAVLVGSNDDVPVVRQKIEFTDFPLESVKLYLIDNVVLLPSEY